VVADRGHSKLDDPSEVGGQRPADGAGKLKPHIVEHVIASIV